MHRISLNGLFLQCLHACLNIFTADCYVTEHSFSHTTEDRIVNPNMYHTVRFGLLRPHFGHLSCIGFVCVTRKVQEVLSNQNQSVVEKLPSFVKLVSPFRGPITSFQKTL